MSAMMSLAVGVASLTMSEGMKTATGVLEVGVADTRGRSLAKADDHHYSRDYSKLYLDTRPITTRQTTIQATINNLVYAIFFYLIAVLAHTHDDPRSGSFARNHQEDNTERMQ